MRPQSTPATITGKVKRYSRQGAGSFRNALIEGQQDFVTLGIGEDLTHPQIGDVITVYGVRRDGKFLTERWEYVERLTDQPG